MILSLLTESSVYCDHVRSLVKGGRFTTKMDRAGARTTQSDFSALVGYESSKNAGNSADHVWYRRKIKKKRT